MITKPREAEYEPILCQICLVEIRAQKTWVDEATKTYFCPFHGPVAITAWMNQ